MRKRLLKYLRRLLYVVLTLGLIGFIAFWSICYSPFEGEVLSVEDLVPPQVEFLLRADYDELVKGGWIQANILSDHPVHPQIEIQKAQSLPAIEAQIRDLEAQVNAGIPLGLIEFNVADDVLSGEIIIGGVFCEGTKPPQPPSWQELLILKRLPWKSRAGLAAALGNEWIRDMAVHPSQVRFADMGNGVFKLTLPQTRVRSIKERSGCGRGYVMPPDNEWYVFRTKDVVAISNSKPLIMEVEQRSRKSIGGLEGDDGLELPFVEPGRVVAAADLEPLQRYLYEIRDSGGGPGQMANRFVNTRTLRRLAGYLDFENPEILRGKANVDVRVQGLAPDIRELYRLRKADVRAGLTRFVPAEDTFMVATLSIQPMTFFTAIVEDFLSDKERKRINFEVKKIGEYEDINQFLEELAERLGDTSYIALGRLSETFDEIEYQTWLAPESDPEPAFAFMTRIREGTNLEEINGFLKQRVALLGFGDDFEQKQHMGIPYTRIHLGIKMRDYALLSPCWLLAQDHFVFCQNETYFKKIIETIADPTKSLAEDNNFRVTMGRLEQHGHLGIFLDLDKFLRVPETSDVGGMPRGFMWDRRNLWVTENRDSREEALRYQRERTDEFQRRHGRRPNDQQMNAIYADVDEHVLQWQQDYPVFIEEYRELLEGFRRMRSLGIVIGAEGDDLSLDAVLFVKPRDADDPADPAETDG